ncbi:phospholipid-transporting ATPase ABCA3-like [Rhynchonycteris naso]
MALLAFNQFSVLLWKNFTIKRRQPVNLTLDVCLALVYPALLWLSRGRFRTDIIGPLSFNPLPIGALPSFIQNPSEWELIYVPSNINVLKEIMENVKRNLNISIKVQGFLSEAELENYLKYDHSSERALAGIVFDNEFEGSGDPLPLQKHCLSSREARLGFLVLLPCRTLFSRVLCSPSVMASASAGRGAELGELASGSLAFSTRDRKSLFPPLLLRLASLRGSETRSSGYISEGFVAVQHAVDKAIMLYHGKSAGQKLLDDVTIFIQRFPYPAYSQNDLVQISTLFFPLAFILMFSPTVLSVIQSIVCEKEKGLKEYQLIVGLRNWMIWTSYFFTVFFFYIIIITLICVILLVKVSNSEPLLHYSDYSLIFIFLMCYAIASTLYGFMISTFFSKVHLAASVGSFLFFASFFPFKSVSQNYGQITLTTKVAACLSSNVALALGVHLLMKLEIKQIGAKWDNLWTPATIEDNLTFGYIIGMLLLDALLYSLVTWYIETVFPGVYGMSQPWYFFLMRSYWYGHPRIRRGNEEIKDCEETQYFEAASPSWVAGIQIKQLHKTFGDKVAVNNISLNLYKGQITILLGESKSGKTTVLSILTGHCRPTAGEAYVNGYDISKHMPDIQKNLDFCPQQDLLFNDLTLSEHLYFYSKVKRKCPKMLPAEIDHMLSTFNLQEDRDTMSKSLSEGMKRKLSLMITLMGASEVVILDEPSSGMDPLSKRITWDLLQQYKHNRTILVTTHHMEEADILGDRIAIMVNGTLKCCGSSVFLKEIYGASYHVVMDIEPQCDVDKISAVIQYHIPDAILEKYIGAELSFILPKKHIHRFEALFDAVMEKKRELGIARFDVSVTTMEEVFLKVSKLDNSQTDLQPTQMPSLKDQKIRQDTKKNMIMHRNYDTQVFSRLSEIATMEFNTGFPLYCQQLRSMLIKKALFSWRNWKLMLLQTSILLVLTAYLLTTNSLSSDIPVREMDLGQYGRTIVPYSVSGKSDLAMNLIRSLKVFLEPKNQELRQVQGKVTNSIVDSKEYRDFSIVALSIEVEENRTVLTILFNNEGYHAAATSVAVLDNVLFMSLSGPRASIQVANKPQPIPLYSVHTRPEVGMQVVLNLAFTLAVLVSSFGYQAVTERSTKAKHIQFVSGVSVLTYWLSALLWDLICFFVSCCLLLVSVSLKPPGGPFPLSNQKFLTATCSMASDAGAWVVETTICIRSRSGRSRNGDGGARHLGRLLGDGGALLGDGVPATSDLSARVLGAPARHPAPGLTVCARPSQGLFKLQKLDVLVQEFHCLDTLLILMLYGWAAVPLTYLGTFLFSSSAAAFIKLSIFHYLSTVFSIVLYSVLLDYGEAGPGDAGPESSRASRESGKAHLGGIAETVGNNPQPCKLPSRTFLDRLLMWLPSYNFTMSFIKFFDYYEGKVSIQVDKKYMDENVESERKQILAQTPRLKNSPLLLKELTKIYYTCPVVKAVRNISLVVQKSECFGLLGLNGAGKTTVFKMLTGEETVTSGVVFIDGISITENIKKVSSRIGYCPQVSPLLSHMTGRELLVMYARLQGVPEPSICSYVETFLRSMHLETHADKVVSTYSGKDKRKLNTVIALMGKPSVVFLDEPSTGMDAGDRRLLWNIVTWMCQTGKAIIISSHSMEECEAICTRLAIMVKGRFKCLGSPQHLKSKFGDMYTLTVKINIDEKNKLKEFKEFIATTFPASPHSTWSTRSLPLVIVGVCCKTPRQMQGPSLPHCSPATSSSGNIINQEYRGVIYYHIPKEEISWGKMFSILEEAKGLFNLEDYFISPITMEQVFLAIANIDKMENDEVIKLL